MRKFLALGIVSLLALATTAGAQTSSVTKWNCDGTEQADPNWCEVCTDLLNISFDMCYASPDDPRDCVADAIIRAEHCMASHNCIGDPWVVTLLEWTDAGWLSADDACQLLEAAGVVNGYTACVIGQLPHTVTKVGTGASEGVIYLVLEYR